MAKQRDWVQIHSVVLAASERAPQIPDDTKKVPLEMWVKGFLVDKEAAVGDVVTVKTVTGRDATGILIKVHPTFDHSFGEFIPEILEIDQRLHEALYGGDD